MTPNSTGSVSTRLRRSKCNGEVAVSELSRACRRLSWQQVGDTLCTRYQQVGDVTGKLRGKLGSWNNNNNNNNNNNTHICIAPYGRKFRGAVAGGVLVRVRQEALLLQRDRATLLL